MSFVHWSVLDGVATATLDRPPLNVLSTEVLLELGALVTAAEEDKSVRCVVITGAGTRAFAAGADIKEAIATPLNRVGERTALGQKVTRGLESLSVPVIAAINGACLGGGCELAMAADIRIASTRATFGQPELRLGIMPGFGGTQRLPRLVGRGRALELLLTGRTIDADEALQSGLVNRVSTPERLMTEAVEMATAIAALPPMALANIKAAVYEGGETGLDAGLKMEWSRAVAVRESRDALEGLSAFVEKRRPRFGPRG